MKNFQQIHLHFFDEQGDRQEHDFYLAQESYPLSEKDYQRLTPQLPLSLQAAHPSRIQSFLAGRMALQRVLMRQDKEALIPIAPDHRPDIPQGLLASLSHSHSMAVAIGGIEHPLIASIGIDCEKIIEGKRFNKVKQKIFHPQEQLAFDRLRGHEQIIWGTLIFSAKETLYKLLYPLGLAVDWKTYFCREMQRQDRILFEFDGHGIPDQSLGQYPPYIDVFFEQRDQHLVTWAIVFKDLKFWPLSVAINKIS